MTKIILESYPANRLPEDIQQKLNEAKEVKLTVEFPEKIAEKKKVTLEEIFAARRPPYLSADEIMKEIYEGRYDDP